MNAAYFDIITESVLPLSEPMSEGVPPRGVNRILIVCRPFNGLNRCHEYQPPFGLKEYDSRSGLPPEGWSDLYAGTRRI